MGSTGLDAAVALLFCGIVLIHEFQPENYSRPLYPPTFEKEHVMMWVK